VSKSLAPDAAQFASELEAVSRSAYLLARSCGRSADEAADVVQESALQAWRYRDGRRGEFRPWFLTIVHRVARRRRLIWETLPVFWQQADPAAFSDGFDPDLAAALAALPSRQRAAMWLRYGEDMSTADVATVMSMSDTAVKQLLQRGRDSLRRRLSNMEIN
jgi:RNA polymerase sigma-70 factor (ECF subfamily)